MPPVIGGTIASGGPLAFSWAFFLAASACWTFFCTTGGGADFVSGVDSSSLEVTEFLLCFCCFCWAAVCLVLDFSDSFAELAAPPEALLAAAALAVSELLRRMTRSLVLGALTLELLLLALGVVVSCELEESLSLLELPDSLPLELLSLELESDELALLDSVLLVDFLRGGIFSFTSNRTILQVYSSSKARTENYRLKHRENANSTSERKHQQTNRKLASNISHSRPRTNRNLTKDYAKR